MKCRDARELLNSYIDNGLDPERDQHLMEHVKKCPKCSVELRLLMEYKKILKDIEPVKAPQNFMSALHKRLGKESASPLRRFINDSAEIWKRFRFPYEAAGVIAIAFLIFFLYTPFFHREKPTTTYREEESVPMEDSLRITDKKPIKITAPVKKSPHKASTQASDEQKIDEKYRNEKILMKEANPRSAIEDRSFDQKSKTAMVSEENNMGSVSAPEKIIFSYEGKILKKRTDNDGTLWFSVMIDENRLPSLVKSLKKNYSITEREISRSGKILTIEFIVRKKPAD